MFQKRLKQYAGIAPVPVAVKSGQHHKTGLLSVEEVEKYGYGSIGPLQQIWGTPTHPHSRVDDNAKYGLPFSSARSKSAGVSISSHQWSEKSTIFNRICCSSSKSLMASS